MGFSVMHLRTRPVAGQNTTVIWKQLGAQQPPGANRIWNALWFLLWKTQHKTGVLRVSLGFVTYIHDWKICSFLLEVSKLKMQCFSHPSSGTASPISSIHPVWMPAFCKLCHSSLFEEHLKGFFCESYSTGHHGVVQSKLLRWWYRGRHESQPSAAGS